MMQLHKKFMHVHQTLFALLLVSGVARAEEAKLTIALYVPNAPFESGEARYNFVSKVAQAVTAAGVPAEPKAFAKASDFEAAIKKNAVDFAIVDGVYLAERGVPWQVFASATSGGETSARWGLFSSEAGGIVEMQGKKLALPSTGGKDTQFIENALLDGELPKHFGARQSTPDIASAVQAVTLKKAECVFAPDSLARSLRKVYDAGKVPNPAFVQIRTTLTADVVTKVRAAVAGTSGGAVYDSWRVSSADAYRSLSGRLGVRTRRAIMAEPEVVNLAEDSSIVVPLTVEPLLPDVRDQFWTPTGAP